MRLVKSNLTQPNACSLPDLVGRLVTVPWYWVLFALLQLVCFCLQSAECVGGGPGRWGYLFHSSLKWAEQCDWTEVEGEDSFEIAVCSEATKKCLQGKRGRRKKNNKIWRSLASQLGVFHLRLHTVFLQFATYCAFRSIQPAKGLLSTQQISECLL